MWSDRRGTLIERDSVGTLIDAVDGHVEGVASPIAAVRYTLQ